MRTLGAVLLALCLSCSGGRDRNNDVARWEERAEQISITRDDWGIPHIRAKTDADAVFGAIYAQAEDDFNRVEMNFVNAMGRLAETEGEQAIYTDLRMKLFIDPEELKEQYTASPPWLKALMDAWADGLNFYLHTHPEVTPKVITRFEPWMALSFSEGSIGGDIERVSVRDLKDFYNTDDTDSTENTALTNTDNTDTNTDNTDTNTDNTDTNTDNTDTNTDNTDTNTDNTDKNTDNTDTNTEPSGSNGFAIAPANTASGHAMLLINPHTSFFFREELQMTSDEGLNAYGAVTWGQFFVYQGFNETAGWMHTSSGADNIDEYLETVARKDSGYVYRYGQEERPVITSTIKVPYKTATGMAEKTFTVYRTHHGPIVRKQGDKWVTVRLMQEPLKALTQSWSRTKAKNYAEFRQTMELHTNSSNNTVFADAEGNIAYFHANFVPERDTTLDWNRPVDGSTPATEWREIHAIDESPNVLNPPNGWIQNTNNWPYSAAGPHSPKRSAYPRYMETSGENPRGIHAIRVLEGRKGMTLDSLIAAAYDSYLPAFETLIPPLLNAYDRTPGASPLKAKVAEQVEVLRAWDLRWSASSVATSLAVFWGEEIGRRVRADAESEEMSIFDYVATRTPPQVRLEALDAASAKLAADFGTWKTPWGDINRFQRLTGDIVQPFNDSGPSIPVPFTSSRWGSLASFGARPYPGTRKWYGTSGNSFVAVVEFGDSVRAKAVTAGGVNGHPASRHFNDQAERYAAGDLREVYFYPSQLEAHTERKYSPGR